MSADRPLLAFDESHLAETPDKRLARAARETRSRRGRVALVVAGTLFAHAALFAALSALPTAKAQPSPREVEVMRFEAVTTPGGAAVEWRGEGGRRVTRIRPDPAMYAR